MYIDIGIYIKNIRTKNGYSGSAFAKEIGITRTYLWLIENKRKFPSVDLVRKICNRFNEDLEFGLYNLERSKQCENN